MGKFFFLAWLAAACGDVPTLAGGDSTVFDRSSNAFSIPAPGLTDSQLERHFVGDAEFEAIFVADDVGVNPGLGPLYNNVSCVSCHNRDGRGRPHFGPATSTSLIRISDESGSEVAALGRQLQDHADLGSNPEATVSLIWDVEPGTFADGSRYELRRPRLGLSAVNELPSGLRTSMRISGGVFGLGLLEAVPDEELLAFADESDADGDGVSGRVARVMDPMSGAPAIGRFGWKAAAPSLLAQTIGAYTNDMGVTSDFRGGVGEVSRERVEAVAFYVTTLGVPAPDSRVEVAEGRALFERYRCDACHRSTLRTGVSDVPSLSQQTFAAYTDLLLHDMGPGLADAAGFAEGAATATEWRTAPLWGLGLVGTVLPGAGYLHDGRARTIEEAILWHGGEAEFSARAYRDAGRDDREALVAFLGHL